MKVLHIDSSIMADASVSRQLSQAIVRNSAKSMRKLRLNIWIWQRNRFHI